MAGADFALSQQRVLSAMRWLCIAGAAIVVCGFLLAGATGVHYWIDRSGKVLVVVSLGLTYLQFRLEYRHPDRLAKRVVKARRRAEDKGYLTDAGAFAGSAAEKQTEAFERMRRRVFMRALLLAGAGELIAAFGSVAFGALVGAMAAPA